VAASPRLEREARDRPRLRRGPAAFQLLFALVCIGLCYAPDSLAQGRFDIRSAYVERAEGVYQLTATLDFDIGEGARAAVRDGAPFTLHLEIVVRRQRSYWLDEGVAALEQSYELVYHALSDRYLVRNVNSGEQASYATLDAALDSLRVISNLPILDQALVRPERRHEISLRASLDVRTMPDTLRFILFWSDDWRQRSEWYTWSPRL
jgi:Domain of unknown function (DUF4390)